MRVDRHCVIDLDFLAEYPKQVGCGWWHNAPVLGPWDNDKEGRISPGSRPHLGQNQTFAQGKD